MKAGQARLTKQGAQIELARARALQKAAVVDQRRLDLDYTYVRSPVDGVVIQRSLTNGFNYNHIGKAISFVGTPAIKKGSLVVATYKAWK